MITASLRGNVLTVAGHAGYAPAGQDIVCAAVSTVVVLCEATLTAFGCRWTEIDADGTVTITAAGPQAGTVLRVAGATLRQLAAQYPDHVRVIEADGGAANKAPLVCWKQAGRPDIF